MYPVSFEQEVLVGENRAQGRGEEVVGSQVQRGGFHILFCLSTVAANTEKTIPQTVSCLRQS